MPTPDQVIQQRIINGVNRLEDARIGDPGSWWSTINLYGRQPGILAKRPGSKLIVQGRGPSHGGTPNIVPPPGDWTVAPGVLGPGEANLAAAAPTILSASNLSTIYATIDDTRKGTRKNVPQMNPVVTAPRTLPADTSAVPFVSVDVQRVAGLHRLYLDKDKKWLVGAYNFEGGTPDQLFYIIDDDAYLIPTATTDGVAAISGSGADFFFVPFRGDTSSDPDNAEYGYWAIGTNQANQPFVLKKGPNNSTQAVVMTTLEVRRSNDDNVDANSDLVHAVQAIKIWQGSVVYGGFRLRDASGNESRFDHHVCFSIPGEPHKLAQTNGTISTVRIGDSEEEPVTAMAVTAVPTDAVGIKAQLCVFTGRRICVFDGLPPVDNNPLGINFQSTIFDVTGCYAPRTVVSTPYGVMFLGNDGVVYLIKGLEGIVPVGTAVKAFLQGLTPVQQKQCAAVWDPEGFYKLSYPDARPSGNVRQWSGLLDWLRYAPRANAAVPDRQLWADMRGFGIPGIDRGVKWFGPMVGMKHSCMTVADGGGDRAEIYAGSAIDGSIYQVGLPDYVTDPNPHAPTTTAYIECGAVTGLYDLGDAHVDKLITALSFGFGTDRTTSVESSIIVNADNSALAAQDVFTRTVDPSGALLGSTFTLGTSSLTSGDVFELITERPSSRLRGKTFRFTFYETPSAGAKIFFSDLSFRAIVATRRI